MQDVHDIFFSVAEENERLKRVSEKGEERSNDGDVVPSWKSKCLSLQDQLAQNQEKLRKKQDSYLQLQSEKETILSDFGQKLDTLRVEKDLEIFNLREQSQRLQVQLNNGHSGFADFKEKKAKEVAELQSKIENLSQKVNVPKQ